jgi:hypothetical protein
LLAGAPALLTDLENLFHAVDDPNIREALFAARSGPSV